MEQIEQILTSLYPNLSQNAVQAWTADDKNSSSNYDAKVDTVLAALREEINKLEISASEKRAKARKSVVIPFGLQRSMEITDELLEEGHSQLENTSHMDSACAAIKDHLDKSTHRNIISVEESINSLHHQSERILLSRVEMGYKSLEKVVPEAEAAVKQREMEFKAHCWNYSLLEESVDATYVLLRDEHQRRMQTFFDEEMKQMKSLAKLQNTILDWHTEKLNDIIEYYVSGDARRDSIKNRVAGGPDRLSDVNDYLQHAVDSTLALWPQKCRRMDEEEAYWEDIDKVKRAAHRWKTTITAEHEEWLDQTISVIDNMYTSHCEELAEELLQYSDMQLFVFECSKKVDHLLRLQELLNEAEYTTAGAVAHNYKHIDISNIASSLPMGTRIKHLAKLTDIPPRELECMLNTVISGL